MKPIYVIIGLAVMAVIGYLIYKSSSSPSTVINNTASGGSGSQPFSGSALPSTDKTIFGSALNDVRSGNLFKPLGSANSSNVASAPTVSQPTLTQSSGNIIPVPSKSNVPDAPPYIPPISISHTAQPVKQVLMAAPKTVIDDGHLVSSPSPALSPFARTNIPGNVKANPGIALSYERADSLFEAM